MSESSTQTVRARWLIPIVGSPIVGSPIENGFIKIRDGRIESIGNDRADTNNVIDLGDVAIMPGLVNAHTHLEFSDLEKPVGNPGMELADWIAEVIRTRGHADNSRNAIEKGMHECASTGAVLIGDIATTSADISAEPSQLVPTSKQANAPEVIAFAETLGLTPERAGLKRGLAEAHLQHLRKQAGISPHAPYSTPPTLIEECVALARQFNCGVAMHVAESPAERELLDSGSGPFADRLSTMGIDVASLFPWRRCGGSIAAGKPILALIALLAQAPSAMLVHGNDLRGEEIEAVRQHSNLHVVYCPRTHHFFRHERHPVAKLLSAGINVALGTDSRASNPDLSLWREVQFLLCHRQDLSPHQVLSMATIGGAIALRRQHEYGSLTRGEAGSICYV